MLLAVLLAAASPACTNDYGALRFPRDPGDGGAETDGAPGSMSKADGG
jgi:hypothetical protein